MADLKVSICSTQQGVGDLQGKAAAQNQKLGKRLAYLLRYGAKKEGLSVSEKGFVSLTELMTHDLMKDYSSDAVLCEVNNSVSCSGRKRFELKIEGKEIFVRATYKRKFEMNPFHEGTHVYRLREVCLRHICKNIELYSLEEFPDEYLVREIIHKMKRDQRLSNKALENLVGPGLELLDLEGAFITEKTLNIIKRQGFNLKNLTLRGSGYLITDHNFVPLMKKLSLLETLDISGCSHLTSISFSCLPGKLLHIRRLLMSNVPHLSETDVIMCLEQCQNLKYMQIFGNKQLEEHSTLQRILKVAKNQGVYLATVNR